MRFVNSKTGLCLILLGLSAATSAQTAPELPSSFVIAADTASYSDVADLVVVSPLIIDVTVRNVGKLSAEQAIGVPASLERVLVEADVLALIRGEGGITPRVRFLLDVPKNAKGKIPKLKKQRMYLFGRQVKGRPGEVQLARPNALALFSPANDALVRAITKEAVQVDAAPRISSVSSAFHSAGTVIGEGETQVFLKTDNDQPLSLTVLSRPGQQKQWAVSTSEVIDASATAPQRNTLLWYRLACGLPPILPADRVEGANNANTTRAQADYRFVIESLGPCGRKR